MESSGLTHRIDIRVRVLRFFKTSLMSFSQYLASTIWTNSLVHTF